MPFQQIEGAQIAVYFNSPLQKLCKKYFQEYGEDYSGSDEEYEEYPDLLLKEGHCKGQLIYLRHCTLYSVHSSKDDVYSDMTL